MKDKPTVGNLVTICPEHIRTTTENLAIVWEDYVGLTGIITQCFATRVRVEWANGESSHPRPSALKILS